MYESPITVYTQLDDILEEAHKKTEDYVYNYIFKIGVDVNKEELEKALQYDRHQYSKGYKDGYEDGMTALAERLKEKMTLDGGSLSHGHFKWGKFRDYEIDNLVKEMVGD
jgi:uncharacterized lipoprotein YddW (UPF0748 family)